MRTALDRSMAQMFAHMTPVMLFIFLGALLLVLVSMAFKPVLQSLPYKALMGLLTVMNSLFFIFVSQRYLYFFGWRSTEESENRRVRLVSKDRNEIDLYLFNRSSSIDLIYMAGNMIVVEEYLDFCKFLSSVFDCNVVSMVYRGVAGNPGTPSERGIVEDIKVVAQYLDSRMSSDGSGSGRTKKVILGFSIGAAAGIHLASSCSVDSMVLINPFMSLASLVEASRFWHVLKFLLVDKWDNMKNIRNVDVPVYFIVSADDGIVPAHHTDELIKNTERHEKHVIDGADHNTPMVYPDNFMLQVYPVVSKALQNIRR